MVFTTLFFSLSFGYILSPPALLGSYYITADKCSFIFFVDRQSITKTFRVYCCSDILHTYTHLDLASISPVYAGS
ncbi:hypothetical protein BGY98DRAFT_956974 [Russula aff. rugulosa BPL654]|nr:hypothetical protein BGY98DRAFT_956974 [Russula aff. rugulosa BPL654]